MIYKLRKRHRLMWVILAVLLPIGFVAALKAIPAEAGFTSFEKLQPAAYANILSTVESDQFLINYRQDGNLPGRQVEVLIKKPLTSANNNVYLGNSETEKISLLGHLSSKGVYRFILNDDWGAKESFYLNIWNDLKKERVESLLISNK